MNEGDLPRAQMLLEAALASGNPEVEPLARTNLGVLLMRNGDTQAAREEFEWVISSDQLEFATNARMTLGTMLVTIGEADDGFALLKTAADSGVTEQAPMALCLLGEFSYDRGEKQTADEYFERARQRATATGRRTPRSTWAWSRPTRATSRVRARCSIHHRSQAPDRERARRRPARRRPAGGRRHQRRGGGLSAGHRPRAALVVRGGHDRPGRDPRTAGGARGGHPAVAIGHRRR